MFDFPKQPSERFPITVDFVDLLADGETISSKTVSAVDSAGTNATSTIIHASVIDGTSIQVTVKAGTSGTRYKITIQVTTSLTNTYEEDVFMYVKET